MFSPLRRSTVFVFAVVLLLFTLGGLSCGPKGSGSGPDLSVDSVTLDSAEKDFLLKKAKALIRGEKPETDSQAFPKIFAKRDSALFLTLAYKQRTAILEFATGDSLAKALENAVSQVKKKNKEQPIDKARIRLDVIDKTVNQVTFVHNKRPAFRISLQGLYLRTTPPIALHPLEITARGMYRFNLKKGWKFSTSLFRELLKDRGLPEKLAETVKDPVGIKGRTFSVISFIEDDKGDELDLYRWAPKKIEITPELLKQRCIMAGEYLQRILQPDGRYEYIYFPQSDTVTKSYNMLRHCGTTYSLLQLYELTKDPKLLESIKSAMHFVLDDHLSGPREKDAAEGFQCIRGEGKLKRDNRSYCKLGGAGLFLVVLSKYTEATGDLQYLPLMEDLAKFIKFMQQDNGFNQSKYYFDDKPHKPFNSLFYPGESAYGLSLLAEIDQNMEWVDVGHKSINYLHESRVGKKPVQLPVDHWLIISMNELYNLKPHDQNKIHAYDIAKGMIQTQNFDPQQVIYPDIFGGWGRTPQASANSTRTEGLVAAYHMAQKAGDDPEPFFACAENAMNVILRMQYTDVSVSYFKRPKKCIGGFVQQMDSPEIQIDNVQHSLSAMIGVYHIMNERNSRGADHELYLKWRKEK